VRHLAVACSLAAVPLAAAGCGSTKSAASGTTTAAGASSAVQQAVEKTLKAGSEHVAVTATASTGGQDVTLTGSGAFDSKSRRGTLHANVSLGGIQTSIDEVLDGTTAYAQSPLLSSLLPAGKSWLKIDLTAAGKALGVDTTVLRAQDPAVALAQLKALQKVREVGTAKIGGVQTTHYRGTIDVAKLPQGSAGMLSSAGTTLGPADVWVGSDGYVRRQRLTTSSSLIGSAKTVVTTTLSQFGAAVTVTIPADSETVDASKVSIPGIGG
jgi:hypothetical protein